MNARPNPGHFNQHVEQINGTDRADGRLVAALSEGLRGRVFLNADYDHEVIHADHITSDDTGCPAVAVIAYGRAVTYPLHAVRFIDWGLV